MKKQYYICLFLPIMLLAAINSHAQRKEYYLEPNFRNNLLDLVSTFDGGYLQSNDITRWTDTTTFDCLLTKFNASFDTVWQKWVDLEPNMTYVNSQNLLPMPDGSAIILSISIDYDYGLPPLLMRIDAEGNTLWRKKLTSEQYSSKLFPNANNGFFLRFSNNTAQQYDLNGLEIGAPIPWNAKQFVMLPDGLLLANNTKAWKANAGGLAVSDTFLLTQGIQSIDTLENGGVLISGTNRVYRLNSALEPIDTVTLATDYTFRLAGCADGFIATQETDNLTTFRRYDWSGNVVNVLQLGKNLVVERLLTKDSIFVIGSNFEYIDETYYGSSWTLFDHINADGTWSNGNDLALTQVRVDGPSAASLHSNSLTGYYNVSYKKIYTTVRNNGSTVIKNWVFKYPKFSFAYEQFFEKRFEGFNLLPGDSIEVLAFEYINVIYIHVYLFDPTLLCLTVSDVNHQWDDNFDNNLTCDVVEQIIVPVREATIVEAKIYPNPTHSTVLCQLPADWKPASYQILNMMGQVVRSAAFTTPELDVSQLPEGAYQLRVVSEDNALAIGRLVVLR